MAASRGSLLAFTLLTSTVVAQEATAPDDLWRRATAAFAPLPAVAAEDLSRADVQLGRALFWDHRLSGNGQVACASCHLAADHGADRRRFSPDARGKTTARNSQTVFNSMLQPMLRWTGDRTSGAHQAEKSLTGSLGFAKAEDVVPLLREHGYEARFRAAFAEDAEAVSPQNYAKALAAYQATLRTPAPFDRYLGGAKDALDERQRRGLDRFLEIGCADCHGGALLGGRTLRTFGVERPYWEATGSERRDAGLFESTKKEEDRYVFRVSSLRNVAKTGPWFHDGSVADLEQAISVMASVQLGEELPAADVAAIAAFLESLTGEVPSQYAPPRPEGAEHRDG